MADSISISVVGVPGVIRALEKLPKDAKKELRAANRRIAQSLATDIRAAAVAEGRQAEILAPTVRARSGDLPVVMAGGTALIGRNEKPAYKLLFGSEFGAVQLKQYKPRKTSYWFFATVKEGGPAFVREWLKAADAAVSAFGGGV